MAVQGDLPSAYGVGGRSFNNRVHPVAGLRARHLVTDTGDADATDGMCGGCADDGATVRGFIAEANDGKGHLKKPPAVAELSV